MDLDQALKVLCGGELVGPLTQRTAIIFDWDDTLLASHFLSQKGLKLGTEVIPSDVLEQLKALEANVMACLQSSIEYGDVYIITNAEEGWVQLSAQKFLPGIVPLLASVKIVSARSVFQGMFPEAPLKWKYYAMQDSLARLLYDNTIEKNIISLGDSHVEREAVRAVTRFVPTTFCKSVKFAERPSMEVLMRQLGLIKNCLSYIFNHKGDLDLQLTITVSPSTSQESQKIQEPTRPDTPRPEEPTEHVCVSI
jgi:hypothetical protein